MVLECPVCLEDLDPDNQEMKIVATSCGHIYHQICLQSCTNEVNKTTACPQCRTILIESKIHVLYMNTRTDRPYNREDDQLRKQLRLKEQKVTMLKLALKKKNQKEEKKIEELNDQLKSTAITVTKIQEHIRKRDVKIKALTQRLNREKDKVRTIKEELKETQRQRKAELLLSQSQVKPNETGRKKTVKPKKNETLSQKKPRESNLKNVSTTTNRNVNQRRKSGGNNTVSKKKETQGEAEVKKHSAASVPKVETRLLTKKRHTSEGSSKGGNQTRALKQSRLNEPRTQPSVRRSQRLLKED